VEYASHESKSLKATDVKVTVVEHMYLHTNNPKRGYNFSKETALELYPVFVDLYLLGYSAYITKRLSGFGLLGSCIAGE